MQMLLHLHQRLLPVCHQHLLDNRGVLSDRCSELWIYTQRSKLVELPPLGKSRLLLLNKLQLKSKCVLVDLSHSWLLLKLSKSCLKPLLGHLWYIRLKGGRKIRISHNLGVVGIYELLYLCE